MKFVRVIVFLVLLFNTYALLGAHKYWVELEDKKNTPFSIDEPHEFLSDRAIQRRFKQGIAVSEQDLPVSPIYLRKIKASGIKILYSSKWFNSVVVTGEDHLIERLGSFPFVKNIQLVEYCLDYKSIVSKSGMHGFETSDIDRGFAYEQMSLLQGQFLHQSGFKGAGKMVAVIDGGFAGLQESVFFDSLRSNNLLHTYKDFVDPTSAKEAGHHGCKVLSVMAANQPGILVGVAPEASYICIRSEDHRIEMRIEECNWIVSAEYADSLGVDIINTSLGYAHFSLPSMNYDYTDLDGQTSLITQAADIAFAKGILVVTSAGNNGSSEDGYIDAPGDAKNILTVGATNMIGKAARFSSFGPTADGRIKPEIVAPGQGVSVGSIAGPKVHGASGTSYSAPIISGLAAALWSAFPNKTNEEIRAAIIASASHADKMNNKTGAGLPDFQKAFQILKEK